MVDLMLVLGVTFGVVVAILVVMYLLPGNKPKLDESGVVVRRMRHTDIGIYVDGVLVASIYDKHERFSDSQILKLGNAIRHVVLETKEQRSREIGKLLGVKQ